MNITQGMMYLASYTNCNKLLSTSDSEAISDLSQIFGLIRTVYNLIVVVAIIIIIFFAVWDLAKAVMAGKDEEIKKAQSGLVRKIITVVLIFLIWIIIKVALRVFTGNGSGESSSAKFIDCVQEIMGF